MTDKIKLDKNGRRIGIFKVTGKFYHEFWKSAAHLVVPERVEHHYYNNTFEIIGVSDLFDKIGEDDPIPEYRLEFKRSDKAIEIKAVRI